MEIYFPYNLFVRKFLNFLFIYSIKEKIWLHLLLKKKFNIDIYFENLTIELHDLYILNTYVKFHSNRILFTIRSINLFFMNNFRLQNLKI